MKITYESESEGLSVTVEAERMSPLVAEVITVLSRLLMPMLPAESTTTPVTSPYDPRFKRD